MRNLAQKIGVAHRTLHHHFGDREGLLREVSAVGFTMLAERLSDSFSPQQFMDAYLRFGLDHPQLYALMMRQQANAGERCARLQIARQKVISLALAALAEGEADPDEARRRVMRSWMLLHGGLSLNATGTLMPRDREAFVAEMMQIASRQGD